MKAQYSNITITLHDPPLVKYPFYEFENSFLTKVSKFYDKYFNSGGAVNKYLKKIKLIYVLSDKGIEALKKRYNITNVQFLPHILDVNEIEKSTNPTNNFIYLGFIGKNKGIEYSLQLHQNILKTYPDVKYYVAGTALGHQIHYYNYLKNKYVKNVEYLGYVTDEELTETFKKATFAPILFNSYKFYQPFSGSILYSLKKGKIVLTNNVNATSELIEHGKNGLVLSGNLEKDTDVLAKIFKDKPLQENIKEEISKRLVDTFSKENVNNYFKN
ncbi:MAG: glycosyltransferase [Gloeobacteraceae cyanobacterium ES-bin-316]|nr:glycosyltransferase [Ferruginibacter sp.]